MVLAQQMPRRPLPAGSGLFNTCFSFMYTINGISYFVKSIDKYFALHLTFPIYLYKYKALLLLIIYNNFTIFPHF